MRARTVVGLGLTAIGLLISMTLVLNWLHVLNVSSEGVLALLILLVLLIFPKPLLASRPREIDLDREHG